MLHLGLFLATLILPFNATCNGKPYGNAIPVLAISHGLNCIRMIVNDRIPMFLLRWPSY